MVGVAQLVEHLVVAQVVVGSSPITHPILKIKRPLHNSYVMVFFLKWIERCLYSHIDQRLSYAGDYAIQLYGHS